MKIDIPVRAKPYGLSSPKKGTPGDTDLGSLPRLLLLLFLWPKAPPRPAEPPPKPPKYPEPAKPPKLKGANKGGGPVNP